ncbi:hypothetical protein CMI37_08700 [Candidatus Pacearchaeota archaeon]|nr:hypothetical protein [Candidatus Pacearchaeota archaeon]
MSPSHKIEHEFLSQREEEYLVKRICSDYTSLLGATYHPLDGYIKGNHIHHLLLPHNQKTLASLDISVLPEWFSPLLELVNKITDIDYNAVLITNTLPIEHSTNSFSLLTLRNAQELHLSCNENNITNPRGALLFLNCIPKIKINSTHQSETINLIFELTTSLKETQKLIKKYKIKESKCII